MKLWGVFSNKESLIFYLDARLSVYLFNIAPQKTEEKGVLRLENQIDIFSLKSDQNRVRSGFIATSFRPCYLH